MSENDNKTTKRLTIHRSYQKPPQIENINISLYKQQVHLQEKRTTSFGPPQLSPKMLPKAPGIPQDPADLQGTPQINVLRSHFQQRIQNIDMFQSQLLTLNSEQLAQSSARFTCCFQVIAVAKNIETGGGGVSP